MLLTTDNTTITAHNYKEQ